MSRNLLPFTIELETHSSVPVALQIEQIFKEAISSGKLKPGQRLPSNSEIATEIGASCTAVQKAFSSLTREGLVSRKPRRGTFISEKTQTPTILLVFGINLMAEFAHFYRAFNRCCQASVAQRSCNLKVFDLPLEECPGLQNRWKEFKEAIKDPSVIGTVLFAIDPSRVRKIIGKIPSVLYQPGDPENDVLLDSRDFMRQCFDFFERSGKKQIAYVSLKFERVTYHGEDIASLLNEVAERNVPPPQLIPLVLPYSGREHEGKAFQRTIDVCEEWKAMKKMPDGIIVYDDVIMRPISMALAKAGVDDPQKTPVVVRTIKEFEYHYAIPVARYRYSIETMVSVLLERLWKKMENPRKRLPMAHITGVLDETMN